MQLYLIKPSQTGRVSFSKQSNPRQSKRVIHRAGKGQGRQQTIMKQGTNQDQNTKGITKTRKRYRLTMNSDVKVFVCHSYSETNEKQVIAIDDECR